MLLSDFHWLFNIEFELKLGQKMEMIIIDDCLSIYFNISCFKYFPSSHKRP